MTHKHVMASVPVTVKVAFGLLAVGLVVFLVGFFSPYWVYIEYTKMGPNRFNHLIGHFNYGLWTFCQDTVAYYDEQTKRQYPKVDQCWNLLDNPQWMVDETRASQFFETAGLLLVISSLILLLITVLVGSCNQRRILPILSAVFCMAAAGSIILGAIIYGTEGMHTHNLAWAFAVTIVGGIIFAVSGIFIIIGAIIKK